MTDTRMCFKLKLSSLDLRVLDLSKVYSHRNTCWQIDLLACGFIGQELAHYTVNFSHDSNSTVSSANVFLGSFFYLDSTSGFACWFLVTLLEIFTYSRLLGFN